MDASLSLAGKRAIVCGSTQGIGRACAEVFAAWGAEVTLVARHEEALAGARAALPTDGDRTHHQICVDFADPEAVASRIRAHVDALGPHHILLNNTGGPAGGAAYEASPDEYTAAFGQHLLVNQLLVQAVVPGMQETAYGRILNVISTSVITPIRGLGVSNTIRGAVANWARTLAAELGPFGITVNNLLPGFTATARLGAIIKGKAQRAGADSDDIEQQMKATIPVRRFADPAEIANVAAFLASPAAAYVNGVNLPVDGGRLAAQ